MQRETHIAYIESARVLAASAISTDLHRYKPRRTGNDQEYTRLSEGNPTRFWERKAHCFS